MRWHMQRHSTGSSAWGCAGYLGVARWGNVTQRKLWIPLEAHSLRPLAHPQLILASLVSGGNGCAAVYQPRATTVKQLYATGCLH